MPEGFMFWGLFLALAAILAGYIAWMVGVERRVGHEREPDDHARAPGSARTTNDDAGAGGAPDDVA